MERREALKGMAILMGTAISASTLSVLMESCQTAQTSGKLINFSTNQTNLLTELADVIVPATPDSGGAKEANVVPLIPVILNDCYPVEKVELYKKGLESFEKTIKDKYGKDFDEITPEQRLEATKALREVALANKNKKDEEKDPQGYFFIITRDLTLLGYYTSEIGYTKALAYYNNDIPEKYNGNVTLQPGQKRWG